MNVAEMKLAIIGAGGHGRVVADAAMLADYTPGFILPDGSPEKSLDGYPVLGTDKNLADLSGETHLVVAIGDNWRRAQLVQRIWSTVPHAVFAVVIHPDATVSAGAVVAAGTVVLAGAIVNTGARVGAHCIINTGAVVEHDNVVGDYASIAPRAVTGGTTHIGDYTAIGIGATVLHGISIGAHAVIGAAALVNRDLPDGIVAYGIPARVIRKRNVGEPYL